MLHDEVDVSRLVASNVVDWNDVWMIELTDDTYFVRESKERSFGANLGAELLDGDGSANVIVAC